MLIIFVGDEANVTRNDTNDNNVDNECRKSENADNDNTKSHDNQNDECHHDNESTNDVTVKSDEVQSAGNSGEITGESKVHFFEYFQWIVRFLPSILLLF